MQIILILSTIASLIFLTIYGSGIFARTVFLVAIPISITALITILKNDTVTTETPSTKVPFYRSIPLIHIAILSFILLTLIPLPKPVTIITGHQRYKQNEAAVELLHKSEDLKIIKPHIRFFSTTRNRAGTMRVLLLLAAIYSAFEAVRLLNKHNRRIYLHTLIFIGTAVAVSGYLTYTIYPQGNKLWWLFNVPNFHLPPVGSFINLNHYAGFITMLSITALCTGITNIRTKHPILAILTITASLSMAAFVIISGSRGSIIALCFGLLAVTASIIFTLKKEMRLIALLTVAIAIICAAAIALMSPKVRQHLSTLNHPLKDYSVRRRLCSWNGAVKIWIHHPIAGAGANAFRFTYSQYKDKQFRTYRRFAENEFFHILSEGGLIGILLSAMLLLAISPPPKGSSPGSDAPSNKQSPQIHPPSKNASSNLHPSVFSPTTLSAAILITGLTHASIDFIMHLPLYVITLATIIAAGLPPASNRKHLKAALAITLIISISLTAFTKAISKYDSCCYVITASSDELSKLLTWSPTNPHILRRLSANCARLNTPSTDELAEEFITLASQYDPNDIDILIQLGKIQLKRGNKPGADKSFKKAKSIRPWAPIPKIE